MKQLICATPSRPEKDAISKGTKKRKSVSVGKYLMWGYLHGLLQSRHSYGILELASGYKNLPGYCMYRYVSRLGL